MAIKNGRCSNCGSIIRLGSENDYAVCPFCYAVTDTKLALSIEENPDNYTFPNEPQPEPSAEQLQLSLIGYKSADSNALKKARIANEAAAKRAKKEAKPSAAERVAALKSEPFTVPKTTWPQRLAILAGILVFIGVILALGLPKRTERLEKQKMLKADINKIATFEIKDEKHYYFDGLDNETLMIVAPKAVTEAEALEVYENFKQSRQAAYGLSESDVQDNVNLIVMSAEGSVEVANGEAKIITE